MMVRVPLVGAESGGVAERNAEQVVEALRKANLGNFKRDGAEIVGPAVGRELTSKGIWATVLSLAGILAYLAFRFQLSFGVGAVVATVHDLLVTFAFLAFFQIQHDAECDCRNPDDDRLFDQRHDRHLQSSSARTCALCAAIQCVT